MSAEILIVDDNSDIRFILDELIKEAGYKTRLAANFNQALTEIDKKLPDVAIIDVKLDKGDNDGILLLIHQGLILYLNCRLLLIFLLTYLNYLLGIII